MKYPWIQFFASDWLNDPKLSMCQPETRGIWMDLLCAMHLLGRKGVITGTREQLSRIARCSVAQLDRALNDIQTCDSADVTLCNKNVTVINRRMKREDKERNDTKLRVQRHRGNGDCNGACNKHSHISDIRSHKNSPPYPPAIEPPNGFPKTEAEARERAGMLGIGDGDFVVKVWNKAMARGGRDSRDMEIRSFPHWIQAEWAYEQDRLQREKHNAAHRSINGQSVDRNQGTFNQGKTSVYAGITDK